MAADATLLYTASIGDVWRAWRGTGKPLRAFVETYIGVATSPATDAFARAHSSRYPGKHIHSVEFYKRLDAQMGRVLYERATSSKGGKALEITHPGYWQVLLDETPLTETAFGPLPIDVATESALQPTAQGREQINRVLDNLQETGFDTPVTVHQPVQRLGWPAFDINIEEAFYNACQVFGGIDLRTQLTEDGANIRFDGILRERLDEIRGQYSRREPSPFILPTQLVFLEPTTLLRVYRSPPMPQYTASLRDRLALSDLSIEIFERREKAGTAEQARENFGQ